MAITMRNGVLYGGLLATLVATWWVAQQPEENAEADLTPPVKHVTRKHRSAESADTLVVDNTPAQADWKTWQRHLDPVKPNALFSSHSWFVPPPKPKPVPAPPPPPPPKPVAPRPPFSYLGKLEDAPGGTIYFLTANNKVYNVLKGQNIDASWRLDGEDVSNLQLTYLPLGQATIFSKQSSSAGNRPVAE